MRVEFKKKYLDEYNLKTIVRAVYNLFDDYYYKEAVAQEYLESMGKNRFSDDKEYSKNQRKVDSTYKTVEKREKVVNYLKEFDRKLAREQDKVVRDRICKTDKTYYLIKKSCYVKFALRFSLVDGFTKDVFETINLYD